VRVVGGTAGILCFVVWLQQTVIIAGYCVNRNGMERVGVVVSGSKLGVMELGVRVAGGTTGIATGQLVTIKWWGDGIGCEGSR
jgi:hypothetical protein